MDDLEADCDLVVKHGLATGHADNVEQLMAEVLAQVDELRAERDRLRAALEEVADKFSLNELNYRGRVLALTARRALGRR